MSLSRVFSAVAVMVSLMQSSNGVAGCLDDVATETQSRGFFSQDGKFYYLLANEKPLNPPDPLRPQRYRYNLYKINLGSGESKPLVGFSLMKDVAVISHGEEIAGMTALSFKKGGECGEGDANLTTISFVNASGGQSAAVKASGKFALAAGMTQTYLVDLSKNAIIEIDPENFQRRVGMKSPKGKILFADLRQQRLIVWNETQPKGIISLSRGKETKLEIKAGDRLLQDRGSFAAVTAKPESAQLVINEIKGWSGDALGSSFVLNNLPKGLTDKAAGVRINIPKRRLAVYLSQSASSGTSAKSTVVFYRYDKPDSLAKVEADEGESIGNVDFDSSGDTAVFEIRDTKTLQTIALKSFSFVDNKLNEYKLRPVEAKANSERKGQANDGTKKRPEKK